jgi:hypothetical protein
VESKSVAQLAVTFEWQETQVYVQVGFHVPEASMLVEMTSETEASITRSASAQRNPGSSQDPCVAAVDGWRREVIIEGMGFESRQNVDGGRRVLPDVSQNIAKARRAAKVIDGTA